MRPFKIEDCLIGFILLSSLIVISDAARRYTRYPGQVIPNRQNSTGSNTESTRNGPDMGNTRQTQPKLNTGTLSDIIFASSIRPTINGRTFRNPGNPNNRGNGNGRLFRPLPPVPQMVNYTLQDIIEQFPWISNPESVDSILDGFSSLTTPSTRTSGTGGTSSRRHGNNRRIRFNNPRYLREWFEGLNLDNYDFSTEQGVLGANGRYKVRLNQKWRNLPVYGSSVVMEQENDTNFILESADGRFLSGIEEDVTSEVPTLTSQEAIDRAIAHNMDQGKVIQNPTAKLIVDTIGETAVLCYLIDYIVPGEAPSSPPSTEPPPPLPTTTSTAAPPSTTNRWYNRRRWHTRRSRTRRRRGNRRRNSRLSSAGQTAALTAAPRINNAPTEPTSSAILPDFDMVPNGNKRPWVMMNANTGEVYRTWDGLTRAVRPTRVYILTGNPVYTEKQYREVMYKDDDQVACYYQKPLGGGKFLRVNDKTTNPTANVYRFRCSDATSSSYDVTNGAPSTRNNAYKWGSEAVNFLRRTSATRWNFDLNIEAHHTGIHALWNGHQVQLGDGDPDFFYPLTAPDTVVHEVTHAFTEHVSHLEYNGQTAAINEAYSDMAACAFMDFFFKYPASLVYKIGRLSLKRNTALRDLCNPRNPDLLLYRADRPIITSATQFESSTFSHNASSLYSKAFCELSKTAGWNIQDAFRVFTNANVIYWNPKETFNSAACGVKKAAHDFKNTVQSVQDVDRAFAVVDIACDSTDWINIIAAPP